MLTSGLRPTNQGIITSNLLHDVPLPFPAYGHLKKSKETFLLKKRNYKIVIRNYTIPSITHQLFVILDTGAGPNFHSDNQLAPLQKPEVTSVTTATRIHDASEKLLHIVGCLKLFVHVGRLTVLLSFMVFDWSDITVIPGCDIFNQFIHRIYQRKRSVNLFHGQLLNSSSSENETTNERISSDNWRIPKMYKARFPNICSKESVYIFQFSQVKLMAPTERESQILVAPRYSIGKCMEGSAAPRI